MTHTGATTIRISNDGGTVMLLCPEGHVVESVPSKEWGGSWEEARWPGKVVTCNGAVRPAVMVHVGGGQLKPGGRVYQSWA